MFKVASYNIRKATGFAPSHWRGTMAASAGMEMRFSFAMG